MTKTGLAKSIVRRCIQEEENVFPGNNSCYGIALEHLNQLPDEWIEYISTRGGVGFKHYKDLYPAEIKQRISEFTCLRDVFKLLEE